MIARASQLFLPTLRDDPADAEAVSHRLLVRGGYIRQVGAGLWTFLPLGWRVHRKVEQIVREELDAFGAQELLMPVLTPAELWETTGRISIPELFRLKDRVGRDYVLPLTHEETVTFHARELRSYRELPQIWYHFQTKDRDEPRPRGGLLRLREFIMKDAYSFDRDEAGLDQSFRKHSVAYAGIFERCGIEAHEVAAESGMMGGSGSRDFLAPSGSGENTLVTCENGDYAADLAIALGRPSPPDFPEELPGRQYVVGANRDDVHLRGVQAGRDYEPRFADLREIREGDACPECGGHLHLQVAIEVGHIFKLETQYSAPLGATFLDEDGSEKVLIMGSYGIGPARIMAAAVEQNHDEQGIVWPRSITPYDVHVVALPGVEEQAAEAARALDAAGADVLLDDRDQRAGEKFADADLIGCPVRVTVGKKTTEDGAADVRDRGDRKSVV